MIMYHIIKNKENLNDNCYRHFINPGTYSGLNLLNALKTEEINGRLRNLHACH